MEAIVYAFTVGTLGIIFFAIFFVNHRIAK